MTEICSNIFGLLGNGRSPRGVLVATKCAHSLICSAPLTLPPLVQRPSDISERSRALHLTSLAMLPLFGRLSRSRAPAPDREAGGPAQPASRRRAASPAYSQPQSALSQNNTDDDDDDFEDAQEVLGPELPPKTRLSAGVATPTPVDARTRLPLRAADSDQGYVANSSCQLAIGRGEN